MLKSSALQLLCLQSEGKSLSRTGQSKPVSDFLSLVSREFQKEDASSSALFPVSLNALKALNSQKKENNSQTIGKNTPCPSFNLPLGKSGPSVSLEGLSNNEEIVYISIADIKKISQMAHSKTPITMKGLVSEGPSQMSNMGKLTIYKENTLRKTSLTLKYAPKSDEITIEKNGAPLFKIKHEKLKLFFEKQHAVNGQNKNTNTKDQTFSEKTTFLKMENALSPIKENSEEQSAILENKTFKDQDGIGQAPSFSIFSFINKERNEIFPQSETPQSHNGETNAASASGDGEVSPLPAPLRAAVSGTTTTQKNKTLDDNSLFMMKNGGKKPTDLKQRTFPQDPPIEQTSMDKSKTVKGPISPSFDFSPISSSKHSTENPKAFMSVSPETVLKNKTSGQIVLEGNTAAISSEKPKTKLSGFTNQVLTKENSTATKEIKNLSLSTPPALSNEKDKNPIKNETPINNSPRTQSGNMKQVQVKSTPQGTSFSSKHLDINSNKHSPLSPEALKQENTGRANHTRARQNKTPFTPTHDINENETKKNITEKNSGRNFALNKTLQKNIEKGVQSKANELNSGSFSIKKDTAKPLQSALYNNKATKLETRANIHSSPMVNSSAKDTGKTTGNIPIEKSAEGPLSRGKAMTPSPIRPNPNAISSQKTNHKGKVVFSSPPLKHSPSNERGRLENQRNINISYNSKNEITAKDQPFTTISENTGKENKNIIEKNRPSLSPPGSSNPLKNMDIKSQRVQTANSISLKKTKSNTERSDIKKPSFIKSVTMKSQSSGDDKVEKNVHSETTEQVRKTERFSGGNTKETTPDTLGKFKSKPAKINIGKTPLNENIKEKGQGQTTGRTRKIERFNFSNKKENTPDTLGKFNSNPEKINHGKAPLNENIKEKGQGQTTGRTRKIERFNFSNKKENTPDTLGKFNSNPGKINHGKAPKNIIVEEKTKNDFIDRNNNGVSTWKKSKTTNIKTSVNMDKGTLPKTSYPNETQRSASQIQKKSAQSPIEVNHRRQNSIERSTEFLTEDNNVYSLKRNQESKETTITRRNYLEEKTTTSDISTSTQNKKKLRNGKSGLLDINTRNSKADSVGQNQPAALKEQTPTPSKRRDHIKELGDNQNTGPINIQKEKKQPLRPITSPMEKTKTKGVVLESNPNSQRANFTLQQDKTTEQGPMRGNAFEATRELNSQTPQGQAEAQTMSVHERGNTSEQRAQLMQDNIIKPKQRNEKKMEKRNTKSLKTKSHEESSINKSVPQPSGNSGRRQNFPQGQDHSSFTEYMGDKINSQNTEKISQMDFSFSETNQQNAKFDNMINNPVYKQIVKQIKFNTQGNKQEVKIQLRPEHLGRITAKLSIQANECVIRFHVENRQVKEEIGKTINDLVNHIKNTQNINITKAEVILAGDESGHQDHQQNQSKEETNSRWNYQSEKNSDSGKDNPEKRDQRDIIDLWYQAKESKPLSYFA